MSDDQDWAGTFAPLRRAAQEHRADTDRIRRRMDAALDPVAHPVTRPVVDPARAGRRLPLAVAAVTVLVILAIAQLVADPLGLRPGPDVAGRPAATGTVPAATPGTGGTPSTGPSGPVTGTPTGASGTGLSSTGRPATGSPTSSGTPPSGPVRTGTGTPAAAPVDYRWTALAGSARSVRLPGAGTLDWVYPGARADLKLQRAKRPAAGQGIGLRLPSGATSVAGPLRVTWTDGVPEQDRADDARWLAVPAGGTVAVQLPRSATARTLRLYVGGPGAPFTLGLAGAGVTATTATVTGAPSGPGPSLLTVPVPAGTDLTVTLTAPAGRSGLALGPVVLRR